MKHIWLVSLVFIQSLFFSPVSALAQSRGDDRELVDKPTDEYLDPTFQNLSKLYWRLGMLDIRDRENIDFFLLINECEVYEKFYNNEFEWEKIRRVTAETIARNIQTYPITFEAMIPIYLGKYDIDRGVFSILETSNVRALKKIFLAYNRREDLQCRRFLKTKDIPNYPGNLTIIFNRPLSFKEIPVSKELAELYIAESIDEYNKLPASYRKDTYKRVAYLRIKFEVIHSLGQEQPKMQNKTKSAVVIGNVIGYEIYADSKKEKPLYSENFKKKRVKKRLTRVPAPDAKGEASGASVGQATGAQTSPPSEGAAQTQSNSTNAASGETPAATGQ